MRIVVGAFSILLGAFAAVPAVVVARERLLGAGVLPMSSTPQALGDMVRRDLAQVREMAKTVRMAAE